MQVKETGAWSTERFANWGGARFALFVCSLRARESNGHSAKRRRATPRPCRQSIPAMQEANSLQRRSPVKVAPWPPGTFASRVSSAAAKLARCAARRMDLPSRDVMPTLPGNWWRSVKARNPSVSPDAAQSASLASGSAYPRGRLRAPQTARHGSPTPPAPGRPPSAFRRWGFAAPARQGPFGLVPRPSATAPRDSRRATPMGIGVTVACCPPKRTLAIPVVMKTVTAFRTKDVTAPTPWHAVPLHSANANRVKANAWPGRSDRVWVLPFQHNATVPLR